VGIVVDLIGNDNFTRFVIFTKGTAGADADEAFDTQCFKSPDVFSENVY